MKHIVHLFKWLVYPCDTWGVEGIVKVIIGFVMFMVLMSIIFQFK